MSLYRISSNSVNALSAEKVEEVLRASFPDQEITVSLAGDNSPDQELSTLRDLLETRTKELNESEGTCSKALASMQSFHKQQQDLFDEFVLLRQKYDEQRNTLMNVLWTHCRMHHPELKQIPAQQDPEKFDETDEFIGPYSIGSMLGEGQFAVVHLCTRQDDPTEYALKIIKKDRIMNFIGLRRMSNEIDTLKRLHSKYIVCIHDVIQTATKLYIVTEKGGPDLFEFFDEHPEGVPEQWAKEIMYRVLRAVQFCHINMFCHRDLKPENILMNFNHDTNVCEDLKLCDFGLSVQCKPQEVLTDFCGSPGFFPPEMLTKGSYFGDKCDIWSCGCIFLELILGHEKFCDAWMVAYDYEMIQNKEKFGAAIIEAVNRLPEVLTFSEELNDLASQFLSVKSSHRPSIANLLEHPWFTGDSASPMHGGMRRSRTLSTEGFVDLKIDVGSDFLSPSRSYDRDEPHSPLSMYGSPPIKYDPGIMISDQTDLIMESISVRERKMLEDHNKHSEVNHHHNYHLPPIQPETPSLKTARKILSKGDELSRSMDYATNGQHPPVGGSN